MKVLLKVPLSPYTGYGNDGLGICRSLMRLGVDVYVEPSHVQAPLPPDVAGLLTKTVSGPFDLAIIHIDPGSLEASETVRAASEMVIGWSMWEFSTFGNLHGRSKLRENLAGFDAIIAYDAVTAECFRPYVRKTTPIIIQQGGFWPEDWPEVERDWHAEQFYFCMVGMLNMRKDPWVAIRAFSELKSEHEDFDQNARLSLKTMAPGLHHQMEDVYPGLRIFYDIWDDKTMRSFYAAQHVLLAPSRGEGKNMPALEFQSTGGTVIATDWAGHREWLNPGYNYPLKYTLAPYDDKATTTALNARADVNHLKELMLHTFRNRAEAKQKGQLAAQVIPQTHHWVTVIEHLMLKLKDIKGGERLWTVYSIARQEVPRGNG